MTDISIVFITPIPPITNASTTITSVTWSISWPLTPARVPVGIGDHLIPGKRLAISRCAVDGRVPAVSLTTIDVTSP